MIHSKYTPYTEATANNDVFEYTADVWLSNLSFHRHLLPILRAWLLRCPMWIRQITLNLGLTISRTCDRIACMKMKIKCLFPLLYEGFFYIFPIVTTTKIVISKIRRILSRKIKIVIPNKFLYILVGILFLQGKCGDLLSTVLSSIASKVNYSFSIKTRGTNWENSSAKHKGGIEQDITIYLRLK